MPHRDGDRLAEAVPPYALGVAHPALVGDACELLIARALLLLTIEHRVGLERLLAALEKQQEGRVRPAHALGEGQGQLDQLGERRGLLEGFRVGDALGLARRTVVAGRLAAASSATRRLFRRVGTDVLP